MTTPKLTPVPPLALREVLQLAMTAAGFAGTLSGEATVDLGLAPIKFGAGDPIAEGAYRDDVNSIPGVLGDVGDRPGVLFSVNLADYMRETELALVETVGRHARLVAERPRREAHRAAAARRKEDRAWAAAQAGPAVRPKAGA